MKDKKNKRKWTKRQRSVTCEGIERLTLHSLLLHQLQQTKYHEKTNCTANANMLSQSGQTENKSLKTVCNNLPENLRWSLSKWWNSTTQPKHAHAEKKKEENRVEGNMEERDKKESKSFTHRKKLLSMKARWISHNKQSTTDDFYIGVSPSTWM